MRRIQCLLCLLALGQLPASEAAVPGFPSWPQPKARESSTRTRPQSSVIIQKQAQGVAAKPQRRLRRRAQGSKDGARVWKDQRRLQEERCSSTADCGPNRYCMSCTKCGEYHASLPRETQRRWTCDPCQDGANICESGKYCTVAQDPAEGACPTEYPGCSQHSDCDDTEYCFSCSKCQEYIKAHGTNETIWRCEPCPTPKGGFCSKLWWCPIRKDSVSGSCPEEPGCAKHSDCQEGEYCESCELCLAFRNSLSESEREKWPCDPCPTVGGGICEPASVCQIANDGIDNTCPPQKGCDAHIQCRPDQYCMDCEKCAAYRDSLPTNQRVYWPCGYCPTGRGGLCERRVFCSVADDGVSDTCPVYEGCFKHTDCSDTEFCWSYDACVREDTTGTRNCGDKPIKDGFCNPISTCVSGRSIDGHCRGTKACNSHKDCGTDRGMFCTNWETCMARSPEICGPRPIHREGVCLPVEHCTHGFHAPLRGECPPWTAHNGTAGGQLEVREVLKLNGTIMLAAFHQAINTWGSLRANQERDFFLSQMHDYGSNTTDRDDAEHVGIYEAMGASKLVLKRQVELSCPFVEVSIPVKGPKIYEARIFMSELQMSQKHAECSCVLGETTGRCPRGAGIVGDSFQPTDFCHDLPTIPTDPSSAQEILPNGTIQLMQNCSGSIKVTTTADFELRSPGANVRFLRLDSYEVEEVTLPSTATTARLAFEGESGLLMCSCDDATHRQHCGSLPVDIGVPVVLESINVGSDPAQNTVDQLSRKRYCASCRFALKRFHPVWFYNSAGQAIENQLTLYSMGADLTKPAKLVDSRKAPQGGEGESVQGCAWREDPAGKGPSLQLLRDMGKVLPDGEMTDKWCVVQTGGCSMSAKVKLCVVSGAAGVLIMEAPNAADNPSLPVPDEQGQVYLSEGESLADLVPVLFTSYNDQLWAALMHEEDQRMTAGPGVGVRPALSHAVSLGGARVYNAETDTWTHAGGGFGAQRWMKHSAVRDVLFVCNAAQRILALDTSRSDNVLTLLGEAPESLVCSASPTLRDVYLVDFRQGEKFFTIFIDTASGRNHLIFFETTALATWRQLSEVHANWEHEVAGQGGLGQVVATKDGQKLLVTWHCSLLYCGSQRRSDGHAPGQHLYVLSLTSGLDMGYAPPVIAAVKVPMSSGSIIRDVDCNVQNLCLVSLSWDGVVAVDLAEGPNRFKVIGQHSAAFGGWIVGGGLSLAPEFAYLRMVAGAQKVIASRSRINRFYIERWNFDVDGFNDGYDVAKSLRFDSVWAIDIDNYVRPSFGDGSPPLFDPAVMGRLTMPEVSSSLVSTMGSDAFEDKLAEGLQAALGTDSSRLLVTSLQEAPNRKGLMAEFSILDGYGPSPETLFNALWRQLLEPRSAINSGSIANWVADAKLERVGPPPISFGEKVGRFARDWGGSSSGWIWFFLAALCCGSAGTIAVCWAAKTHMAMKRLSQENRRLREEHDHLSSAVANDSQVGLATGYVIGRPNPEASGGGGPPPGKDPDARDAPGSLSYVVGAPVSSDEATSPTRGGDKAGTEQAERPAPGGWPAATEVSSTPREEIVIRPAVVRAPTFERTDRP